MNKLPLHELHARHAAVFVEAGGYEIPAYYSNAAQEFAAARTAAIMDRSFVGKLRVFGKDSMSLLHRLTTNEMRSLKPGEGVVNIFTNAKGRVVDVVEMFLEEDSIFMLTSPGRVTVLKEWIEKYTFIEDVRSEDVTLQYGVITILGQESAAHLHNLFGWKVENLPAQYARTLNWEGERIVAHRTGSLAPAGLNLITPVAALAKLWELLAAEVTPIGHTAYEMLRIHCGMPAVGNEITEEHNPHEVGLFPFINFEKGCYIGQEVIARLDTYQKVQRQLVGVILDAAHQTDRALPDAGAPIYAGEQMVGQLTSVCFSPERGCAIGLAVARKQFATHDEPVQIRWPEHTISGRLHSLPFANANVE